MKSFIKWLITAPIYLLSKFLRNNTLGLYMWEGILKKIMSETREIEHNGVHLIFSTPNVQGLMRASSFSWKEPETLEWIDRLPEGSVLWDIGANVGIYSCYAAKKSKLNVFAFEPSVFNLEMLARNIYLNELVHLVTIVPLPLSDKLSRSTLNMSSTEWGGALSTFGEEYGHDGKIIDKIFEFPTIGLSMLDAVESLNIPQPDYIKMDVDGIEHLIIEGGLEVLKNVKGILVEINDQFSTQANVTEKLLLEAGFKLAEKRHADYFDTVDYAARYTYNQIWLK
jgi:FkbM family methyltransferase